jgi:hypothetical protein
MIFQPPRILTTEHFLPEGLQESLKDFPATTTNQFNPDFAEPIQMSGETDAAQLWISRLSHIRSFAEMGHASDRREGLAKSIGGILNNLRFDELPGRLLRRGINVGGFIASVDRELVLITSRVGLLSAVIADSTYRPKGCGPMAKYYVRAFSEAVQPEA